MLSDTPSTPNITGVQQLPHPPPTSTGLSGVRRSGTRLLDDPAVEQMDGTVGVGRVSGIVRDHADRRSTAMQLAQQLHNRFAVRRVEVSRRLVGEQDEWIPGNRTRDGDALLLTAGELCGIVLHAMAHADALESVLHALLALTGRHAAVGKR